MIKQYQLVVSADVEEGAVKLVQDRVAGLCDAAEIWLGPSQVSSVCSALLLVSAQVCDESHFDTESESLGQVFVGVDEMKTLLRYLRRGSRKGPPLPENLLPLLRIWTSAENEVLAEEQNQLTRRDER